MKFTVDQDLCVGCGICVAECVGYSLIMKNNHPEVCPEREEACISCQHCMAVCPTGALSVLGLDPESCVPLPVDIPSDRQMEMLIKSRRSTRQYRYEAVDRKILKRLLEITAYAPTGSNNCQVRLSVVDDPGVMDEFRDRTYQALERRKDLPPDLERYAGIVTEQKQGKDTLFRGAPHLVIASGPGSLVNYTADCIIALSYFELQAAAMGIGTTWCGLVKTVLTRIAPELIPALNLPEGHEIGYVMLFGNPRVRYHRTVQRTVPQVNRIGFNR